MTGELKSLTGLRGVAAMLVMVDHYAAIDFTAPFPLDMLPHMYLAVDMFMLLSGFVLAMSHEARMADPAPGARGGGYRRFLAHRIARLFPLYAATTVVCFVLCRMGLLSFLNPDRSLPALGANLVGVQTWLWPGSSLNGPGWSISTEWFANLVFPLLMAAMLGASLRVAVAACMLCLLVLLGSALLFGQLFDVPSPGALNIISGPEALGRCVTEFAIGILCWRLRSRHAWTRVLAGTRLQGAMLLALGALMQSTRLDVAFVAVCALLLVGLSFETSGPSAVLRSAPLLHLGRISYSIYLVHITLLPVRDGLARLFGEHGLPGAWGWAVLCTALLALALATLTRHMLELPAQRVLLAWLRARRAGRT